jgi:hypothetical protein
MAGNETATIDKLHRLVEAAKHSGGRYEVCDETDFRLILEEGGIIGEIRNLPYQERGFKTQCSLLAEGQTLYFCIFTQSAMDWD